MTDVRYEFNRCAMVKVDSPYATDKWKTQTLTMHNASVWVRKFWYFLTWRFTSAHYWGILRISFCLFISPPPDMRLSCSKFLVPTDVCNWLCGQMPQSSCTKCTIIREPMAIVIRPGDIAVRTEFTLGKRFKIIKWAYHCSSACNISAYNSEQQSYRLKIQ